MRARGRPPTSPPRRARSAAAPASSRRAPRSRRRDGRRPGTATSNGRSAALAQQPERRAERLHQPGDLASGGCRAGRGARRARPARAGGARPAPGAARSSRSISGMADIGAGRAAEAPVRLRLERQQRQHVVDIGAHLARPPGPPGPDARADVVDDREVRPAPAHARGDRVGEIRAVDDDEHVRLGRDDRRRPSA